ncbi:unnamed protein product [Chrysodeixis includens]|uniref:Uncharacterized protein n=1 Tax=Chrysodeixis includens TaxID=689277 RepID=A0A9N8PWF7_CHRIL|nr:unnamed protein product [Chrysodeixis includens]
MWNGMKKGGEGREGWQTTSSMWRQPRNDRVTWRQRKAHNADRHGGNPGTPAATRQPRSRTTTCEAPRSPTTNASAEAPGPHDAPNAHVEATESQRNQGAQERATSPNETQETTTDRRQLNGEPPEAPERTRGTRSQRRRNERRHPGKPTDREAPRSPTSRTTQATETQEMRNGTDRPCGPRTNRHATPQNGTERRQLEPTAWHPRGNQNEGNERDNMDQPDNPGANEPTHQESQQTRSTWTTTRRHPKTKEGGTCRHGGNRQPTTQGGTQGAPTRHVRHPGR